MMSHREGNCVIAVVSKSLQMCRHINNRVAPSLPSFAATRGRALSLMPLSWLALYFASIAFILKGVWFRGREFEFYPGQNESAMGEECNGKLPHKDQYPRKYWESCLWFLLRSKLSMQSSSGMMRTHHPCGTSPHTEPVQCSTIAPSDA